MGLSLAQLTHWISLHGPVTLFGLLALGIVGLPIPDETLLIVSGILISKQVLPLPQTLILAPLGAMVGITMSFILGRILSRAMIYTLIEKLKLNKAHWLKIEAWFATYGAWSLTIGYFVPAVRHCTGIFAGLMELSYKKFAFFAYLGAILWSLSFIAFGYFWGDNALKYMHFFIDKYGYGITLLLVFLILGALAYTYKRYARMKNDT